MRPARTPRTYWLTLIPLAAAGMLSCTSATAPGSGITLQVTNDRCGLGACVPFEVVAFPLNVLQIPAGPWTIPLGRVTTYHACFTIPSADTARLINVHADGSADTVFRTWSADDSLALGVFPDTFNSAFGTRAFVPSGSRGWAISVPADSGPTEAAPCNP